MRAVIYTGMVVELVVVGKFESYCAGLPEPAWTVVSYFAGRSKRGDDCPGRFEQVGAQVDGKVKGLWDWGTLLMELRRGWCEALWVRQQVAAGRSPGSCPFGCGEIIPGDAFLQQ